MRNKAGEASQNAPEHSTGNICFARLAAIFSTNPDVKAEEKANKTHKHTDKRAGKMRTEHPTQTDADNSGRGKDRQISRRK